MTNAPVQPPFTKSPPKFSHSRQSLTSRYFVCTNCRWIKSDHDKSRTRKQRREAERKARKLEYQQSRLASAASAPAPEMCGAGSLAGKPVAGPALSITLPPAAPDEPAVLSEAKTQERSGPTGPRSPEGKSISSGNSLKHGLASGRFIIPGEDPADFEASLAALTTEHAPATETEQLLVRQMAQSWWLMQRAIRFQNEAFTEMQVDAHPLALFLRYQTTHERTFYKVLNTLLKLRATAANPIPSSFRKTAVQLNRRRRSFRKMPRLVPAFRPPQT